MTWLPTNLAMRLLLSRPRALIALCLSLGCSAHPKGAVPEKDATLVLHNVTVVDVIAGELGGAASVCVRSGRILAISVTTPCYREATNIRFIDASGLYLIPGLWDMHVHASRLDTFTPDGGNGAALLTAQGITGVRDMGSAFSHITQWKRGIDAGHPLPRIVSPGPALVPFRTNSADSWAVGDPMHTRAVVDSLKKFGADFVKVQSGLSRVAYFAIAEESARQALPLAGHVPEGVAALEAAVAGQKSIEHLMGLFISTSSREDEMRQWATHESDVDYDVVAAQSRNDRKARALFAELRSRGVHQVPTLVGERAWSRLHAIDFKETPGRRYVAQHLFDSAWLGAVTRIRRVRSMAHRAEMERFFAAEVQMVAELYSAGVPIMAGTDAPAPGVVPGFSLHTELELFVLAGMNPAAALRAATILPAQYLGISDSVGRAAPGYVADLVLLESNPLHDIRHTRRIAGLVLRGRYFSRSALDSLLDRAEGVDR